MYTLNTKINNQLSIWLIIMFWIISFMIIVGGLTRLTDSGLSITEWELFSGFFHLLIKMIGLFILIFINKFLNSNYKTTI